ncbi:MAG: hypothetical protein JJU19_14365 [Pararhodobacter sp.]|nr:hypothetical protein [Pararhodobacter sp.]
MTAPSRPALPHADTPPDAQTLDASLARLLRSGALPAHRIQSFVLGGRRLWLKRAEEATSLRLRVQKGDPARALRADIAGLRFMARQGLPSVRVLSTAHDLLVTEDAGKPLSELFQPGSTASRAERVRALGQAMRLLAGLHAAGARHGRPKLRDICWDGQTARLIDFERFHPQARPRDMALDWLILLHSLLEVEKSATPTVSAAAREYLAVAPERIILAARRWISLIRSMRPLLAGLLLIKPHNKELLALHAMPGALAPAFARVAT